ncbi:MAG: hypothetical protein HYZ25_01655 [Chloroflexi bacterium]|nr:hypothetical protein [Chloroflexota bacterium]
MNIEWIPTNQYYRRILAAPAEERQQLYVELFIQPWKAMMDMTSGFMNPQARDDPLAGARAWSWLLPDQAEQIESLLQKMEKANAWTRAEDALHKAAAQFEPFAQRIPFDALTGWLVLGDAAHSNPFERGYTGATDWMQPRLIGQFWEPNADNLSRLGGLFAHEMHHLIRNRIFPWDMRKITVADYIVVEGTAESFATSLFGADTVGFFVSDVGPADLETARTLIAQGLDKTGFDVIRGYLFGDALAERARFTPVGGMPTYGGYAVGYHVVQTFMERTGLSIEETTFLPASEIVERSGYFA